MNKFIFLVLAQLALSFVNAQYGSMPPVDTSYGRQDLSIKLDLPDPCLPNPCRNFGSCLSSDDRTGFWCLCLTSTTGDYCETVVTTTTTTTTTTPLPRRKIPAPVRIEVPSSGYQQQIFRDVPTTPSTTTVAPYQPPQPAYGQAQRFLDLVPSTTPIRVQPPPQPVVSGYGSPMPKFMDTISKSSSLVVSTGCASNPCLNEGSCTELGGGSFRCECPWGWSGLRCEICLTECASNPCPPNKRCRARYGGGFDCVCPPNRSGFNCEIQNDVCSSNPCLNGGLCKPTASDAFTCVCRQGFAGINCEQVWNNPCTDDVLRSPLMLQFEFPWDPSYYIICTDIDTWVKMPCPNNTFYDKRARHCVPDGFVPPPCPEGFCLNDGECVLDQMNQLACLCKPGFTGRQCDTNINECSLNGNACAGGLCVDQINTYYCICPRGVGLDCVNTIPDPCMSDNINPDLSYFRIPSPNDDHFLHCTSLGQWQVRRCADGLFWNQEERTCTMERPRPKSGFCLTFPCKNGGECVDLGGSYQCRCKDGYTGANCETLIDYCLSNPCQNGGRCLTYPGGYTCVCPDKIIDDCCCSGIMNPCPEKSKLVPGVNNYFPHLFKHKYIHCDFDGRAFVRTCAPGTRWVQSVFSCLSEDLLNTTVPAPEPKLLLRDFVPTSSYGQQLPVVPVPTTTTTQATRIIFRDFAPSYGQQQVVPVQQYTVPTTTSTTTTTPAPFIFRDVPQQSYGQQQWQQVVPVQQYTVPTTTSTTTTPAPFIFRDVPQQSYGQQQWQPVVPVQQYTVPTTTSTTTTTPVPVFRDVPVSSYGQQWQQVQQPSYGGSSMTDDDDLLRLSIGRNVQPVQQQVQRVVQQPQQQNFQRLVQQPQAVQRLVQEPVSNMLPQDQVFDQSMFGQNMGVQQPVRPVPVQQVQQVQPVQQVQRNFVPVQRVVQPVQRF